MKQINLTSTRSGTKADDIRRDVQSCGLSGWELDRQRKVIEEQGFVTEVQLEEMRSRAAFALKVIEDAIEDAKKVTGKAVTEVPIFNVVQVRGDSVFVCYANLTKDDALTNKDELAQENPDCTYRIDPVEA